MSYEKSLITETTSAIPTLPQPQMREERIVDPYKTTTRSTKTLNNPNGQPIINGEHAKVAEGNATLTEETVTLSPQMAALARKEQKFRQREQDLKKSTVALEAEKAEIAELKALKAKLATKDYSGIESLVKYDDYTNYLLNKDSNLTPEQQAVKKLAEEVEGLKTSQKQDVEKRFEAAVNERRKAVTQLVATNPEFNRIKKAKAEEAVVQHILDTWEQDQIDLSPEEAAKEVSAMLLEKANEWKALLEEEPETVTPETVDATKRSLPPLKAPIRTLTNNMAATGEIKRPLKSLSNMSDAERYAEARRRAEEKLKLQQR